MEQFELLEKQPPLAKKKIKKPRLPDAKGYSIFEGYAEKFIGKTLKEHKCRICQTIIPAGSRAKEVIQVVNGKLLVHSKEYAHATKGECFSIAD